MKFATMLKRAREGRGLTQPVLARKTGLPLASIRNWEQGHRYPRVPALFRLAGFLGLAPQALFAAIAEDKCAAFSGTGT